MNFISICQVWTNFLGATNDDTSNPAESTTVYAAGCEGYKAKYWKKGVAINLNDEAQNVIATGIAVIGNDVYVIGERRIQN